MIETKNPVLLVHGLWDTEAVFQGMVNFLKQGGWEVYTLNMIPNDGSAPLEVLAEQVASYIEKMFPPEQRFDCVGFSMGGIISRYYLQQLGGIEKVDRLITISSPHYGTTTALGSLLTGCKQMRLRSPFLKKLNQQMDVLKTIQFTSIWSPYDLMIVPASSSQMPVGKNIVIPVFFHGWMVSDIKVLQVVANTLQQPILV